MSIAVPVVEAEVVATPVDSRPPPPTISLPLYAVMWHFWSPECKKWLPCLIGPYSLAEAEESSIRRINGGDANVRIIKLPGLG